MSRWKWEIVSFGLGFNDLAIEHFRNPGCLPYGVVTETWCFVTSVNVELIRSYILASLCKVTLVNVATVQFHRSLTSLFSLNILEAYIIDEYCIARYSNYNRSIMKLNISGSRLGSSDSSF